MLRLILSAIIGYILGKERKNHKKDGGGSRTLALINTASCLLAILSLELVKSGYMFDFVRMFSYSLAGIGFLGAGVIRQNSRKIDGTTTASLIWVSVPIGFCLGLGYFYYGIFTSILVYILLELKYWKL
jgi:putative Mg2+ transporter-C (MgtC) family protein